MVKIKIFILIFTYKFVMLVFFTSLVQRSFSVCVYVWVCVSVCV